MQLTHEMKKQWNVEHFEMMRQELETCANAEQNEANESERRSCVQELNSIEKEFRDTENDDIIKDSGELFVELHDEEEVLVDTVDVGHVLEHKLNSHFSKDSSDASDATEIKSLPDSRSVSQSIKSLSLPLSQNGVLAKDVRKIERTSKVDNYHREQIEEVHISERRLDNHFLDIDRSSGREEESESLGYLMDEVPEKDLSDNGTPLQETDPHLGNLSFY